MAWAEASRWNYPQGNRLLCALLTVKADKPLVELMKLVRHVWGESLNLVYVGVHCLQVAMVGSKYAGSAGRSASPDSLDSTSTIYLRVCMTFYTTVIKERLKENNQAAQPKGFLLYSLAVENCRPPKKYKHK